MTRHPASAAGVLRRAGWAALVLLCACGGHAEAGQRTRGSDGSSANAAGLQADIRLTDGSDIATASFSLRGTLLTVVRPRADDGDWAGLFRIRLDRGDGLVDALTKLPANFAGTPVDLGMPAASFAVRAGDQEQKFVVPLPTSDPIVDRILGQLRRCESAARQAPTLALSLRVEPMVLPKSKAVRIVAVTALAKGDRGAELSFDPGSIALQAAPEPKPPAAGVTPLPPEWERVGGAHVGPAPRTLRAGTTARMEFAVDALPPGTRWLRALLEGKVVFHTGAGSEEVRISLLSKPIQLGPEPVPPKKQ